jgi:hypothetical protein
MLMGVVVVVGGIIVVAVVVVHCWGLELWLGVGGVVWWTRKGWIWW